MNEHTTVNASLLTKVEAAGILRVAPITIHRMIREKRLGSYRVGARVFTTQKFIDDFLRQCERRPKGAA